MKKKRARKAAKRRSRPPRASLVKSIADACALLDRASAVLELLAVAKEARSEIYMSSESPPPLVYALDAIRRVEGRK